MITNNEDFIIFLKKSTWKNVQENKKLHDRELWSDPSRLSTNDDISHQIKYSTIIIIGQSPQS